MKRVQRKNHTGHDGSHGTEATQYSVGASGATGSHSCTRFSDEIRNAKGIGERKGEVLIKYRCPIPQS